MNRISFLNRGYAFKGLLAVNPLYRGIKLKIPTKFAVMIVERYLNVLDCQHVLFGNRGHCFWQL